MLQAIIMNAAPPLPREYSEELKATKLRVSITLTPTGGRPCA